MNIFKVITFLLALFNSNISPDNISTIADIFDIVIERNENISFYDSSDFSGVFVLKFDENFELYKDSESIPTKGIYKLFYHDKNINAQICFYNNKPLSLSIDIINPLQNDLQTINGIRNIIYSLSHRINSWGAIYPSGIHYVFHIYPKDIVFILVGEVENEMFSNFNSIKVIQTVEHPLQYDGYMPW